jgi:hypothetical protein
MSFKVETLTSWAGLSAYAGHGFLFRGQRDASWPLQTALERCCLLRSIPMSDRRTVEDRLFREFRRGYHQYASHVPSKQSVLEWLAVMQHHGAPTRLLDFTYSLYVSAYFALENAYGDCAVWRVNGPWALRASITILNRVGNSNAAKLGINYHEQDDEIFDGLLIKEPCALCACPQTPFRLNERLRTQMGVFLVPGRIDASFEDNLMALPDHDDPNNVLRIVIPSSLRDTALQQLFDMSVSRRTLFPGLDGYAQSLAVYSPAFNPIDWT